MTEQTKVGIGVMILKDGKVLLGKRKGSHGAGEFSFPGGKLDYMESFEGCARRETQEETGMEIGNLRFVRLVNLKAYAPKHFVHIDLVADWVSGEPRVLEPDKVESWNWYSLDQLPEPTFATTKGCIEAYQNGNNYLDA